MKNPKCHKCIHRGNVPGNTHSCCTHPSLNAADEILSLLGVSSPALKELKIEGDPHGIEMGWFIWPVNFDPIWLKNCNGYEEKKEK